LTSVRGGTEDSARECGALGAGTRGSDEADRGGLNRVGAAVVVGRNVLTIKVNRWPWRYRNKGLGETAHGSALFGAHPVMWCKLFLTQ
jgi:hypothetical protein